MAPRCCSATHPLALLALLVEPDSQGMQVTAGVTGQVAETVTARMMATLTSKSNLEAGRLCGRQALSSARIHAEQVCFATVALLPLT